ATRPTPTSEPSQAFRRSGRPSGPPFSFGASKTGARVRASRGEALELEPRQPRIEAARGAEAVVIALLDDAAMVHHQDAVGGADGGEAVGDDDRRPPLEQPLERALDEPLRFR